MLALSLAKIDTDLTALSHSSLSTATCVLNSVGIILSTSPIIFLNPCNCHPAQAKPVSCHCCHPFSRLEKFYSRQHRPALIRRRGKCHLARHLSDHFFSFLKPLLFSLGLAKVSLTSQFRHYRKLLSRNSGKHRHRFPRFNFQFFPLGSQIHSPFRQKSHKLSQIFCRDCDCPL